MASRRTACALLLLLVPAARIEAQEAARPQETLFRLADSVSRRNSIGIGFDRIYSTFNWVGRISVDTAVAGTAVRLEEQFSSNVIETGVQAGSAAKFSTDQNVLRLLVKRPVSRDIRVVGQWSSLLYSDEKSVGLSDASIQSVRAGTEFLAHPSLSLSSLLGYRWDKQGGVRDNGPGIALNAVMSGLDIDGTRLSGGASFEREFVDPRMMASDGIRAGAQKYFGNRTRDSLDVGYVFSRREFYTLADNAIESRLDRVFGLANLLEYEVSPRILTTIFVGLSNRVLDKDLRGMPGYPRPAGQFDARVEEFRLETYLEASYRWGSGEGEAAGRLAYAERDEGHELRPATGDAQLPGYGEANRREQTKNNLMRRTALSGSMTFPFSPSDRMMLSGAASILRYDTPSALNVEDRDELLIAASLGTSHRLSRVMDAGIMVDGSLNHTVYLLKERSANNNVNRVLRITPRVLWRPIEAFASMNAFEVLANYTVYDYELEASAVKSYSYRQFSWLDSTSIRLSSRVALDLFAYLKLYERGQLNWDEFTERPENAFNDQTFSGQLRFDAWAGAIFAIGARYFSQTRYNYDKGVKQVASRLHSIGPTCLLYWNAGRFGELILRGWYETRTQVDGTASNFVTMTFSTIFNF